jgi:3-methyladenine DNA glycosylase AlkD
MSQASEVSKALRQLVDPTKTALFSKFFKAGPGQYAEDDVFLGITVPNIRKAIKPFEAMPPSELDKLLKSKYHEERAAALFILVAQYKRADQKGKKSIYNFYVDHMDFINNWDLVDCSAAYIVGKYLEDKTYKLNVLSKLADSKSLWQKRIAVVATFAYIKDGDPEIALLICKKLINDPHDLIQKAVGWMLREVGKRADRDLLIDFLQKEAATMPRTSLRYAIEHFDLGKRQYFLGMKKTK